MSEAAEYKKFITCVDHAHQLIDGLKWNVGSKKLFYFKFGGKRNVRFTTGVKSHSYKLDPTTAAQAMAKVKERLERINPPPPPPPKLLLKDVMNEMVEQYRKERDAGSYSHGSFLAVKQAMNRLGQYWGYKEPSEINRETWDQFQDWHDTNWPGQDQFNLTKYMRVLRNYCLERGYTAYRARIRDRHAKKQRIERKKRKSIVYTDAEILALERACLTRHERLAIQLGYMMGFRISDCVRLSWDRIALDHEIPHISFMGDDNKTGFFGKCPLPDKITELLKEMRDLQNVSRWVFPQVKNPEQPLKTQQFPFREIRNRAEVKSGTFHGLRHYRLTRDFKNPNFTSIQVCLVRRVSLQTANEFYCHAELADLVVMKNSGVILDNE